MSSKRHPLLIGPTSSPDLKFGSIEEIQEWLNRRKEFIQISKIQEYLVAHIKTRFKVWLNRKQAFLQFVQIGKNIKLNSLIQSLFNSVIDKYITNSVIGPKRKHKLRC